MVRTIFICSGLIVCLFFSFYWITETGNAQVNKTESIDLVRSNSSDPTKKGKHREIQEWLRRIFFPTPAERQLAALAAKQHREYAEKRKADKKKKAEEAAYWESRQEWIDNFPFEPTHHPTITFDPNIYNPVGPGGPSDHTPEGQKMAKMIENHSFLAAFYDNPNRFSKEFEHIHSILLDEGIKPDALLWGWIFTHLVDYHRACTHELSEPWPFNPSKTWGEKKETTWNSILGRLMLNSARLQQHNDLPSEEHARAIRKRLITEIPVQGFLKKMWPENFVYDHSYVEQLKLGDPLLIR